MTGDGDSIMTTSWEFGFGPFSGSPWFLGVQCQSYPQPKPKQSETVLMEFLKVAKQTDSCAMIKFVGCGVPFQNFNFLGGCISQGTALPQSDWVVSWCFSSSFSNLWRGWFFPANCLMGNIPPKPPPLLRIERTAPRTAALEFSTAELGECCGPPEGPQQLQKMNQ